MDGDLATGKAGTTINPDGKAGTWQGFTVWQGKPIAVSTTGKAPQSGESLPTQGHGRSERNPALGRSGWMLNVATGKAGTIAGLQGLGGLHAKGMLDQQE